MDSDSVALIVAVESDCRRCLAHSDLDRVLLLLLLSVEDGNSSVAAHSVHAAAPVASAVAAGPDFDPVSPVCRETG